MRDTVKVLVVLISLLALSPLLTKLYGQTSPTDSVKAQPTDSVKVQPTDSLTAQKKTADSTAVKAADEATERQSIDRLLDRSSETSGNEEVLERLALLRQNKINLNIASYSDLLTIPFLTAVDARAILDYRNSVGIYKSVAELRRFLDEETISLVSDVITVGSRRVARDPFLPAFVDDLRRGILRDQIRVEYIGRVQTEAPARFGFETGSKKTVVRDSLDRAIDTLKSIAYLGSPQKFYNRLQLRVSENFLVSALAEKDIGEQSLTDFTSFTVQAKDIYNLKTFVAGDYNLAIGQGLAMTTARAFFKSPEAVVSAKQNPRTLRAYTSTTEQNFFRGAAAEVQVQNFSLTAFYSSNFFAASLEDTVFTSIDYDGLFRTETELAKRSNVGEQLYGGYLAFNRAGLGEYLHVGVSAHHASYSIPFVPDNQLYNAYRFTGDRTTVSSLDFDVIVGKVNIFGEAAVSVQPSRNSLAAIGGVQTEFARGVKAVVLVRAFPKDYYAPHANVFAERANNGRDETGIYFGLQTPLTPELKLRTYFDLFRFNYISFTTLLPSSGSDWLVQLSYKPSKLFLVEATFQQKQFEQALTQTLASGEDFRLPLPTEQIRARVDFVYQVSDKLRLKTRAERKSVTKDFATGVATETGWLIYQSANVDLLENKLSVDARVAVFETDSFDAAIYAYEEDLPLLATVYAHSGKGRRLFVNAKYQLTPQVQASLRFANVFRDRITSFGDGTDEFLTNAPSFFGAALRVAF